MKKNLMIFFFNVLMVAQGFAANRIEIFSDAMAFENKKGHLFENVKNIKIKDDLLTFKFGGETYTYQLDTIWGYLKNSTTHRWLNESDYELTDSGHFLIYRVAKATKRWEKRRVFNCCTADPNDCVVWCFIERKPPHYYFSHGAAGTIRPLNREEVEIELQQDPVFLERLRKASSVTEYNLNKI